MSSNLNGINYFTLGDVKSSDFGVILTAPPQETFPERDVEFISIPGRSGDLTMDKGRFKDVTVSYSCAIVRGLSAQAPEGSGMREEVEIFLGYLKQASVFQQLKDSYHVGTYRMGRLIASVNVESIAEEAGKFTLTFRCKPQRFLVSGNDSIMLAVGGDTSGGYGAVFNDTAFESKPLITVYGNGHGNLTVGNVTVEIRTITDQITLDCDTMNAWRQVGDGAVENKNNDIFADVFPVLQPGRNDIRWDGGISSIEITPRWWTI